MGDLCPLATLRNIQEFSDDYTAGKPQKDIATVSTLLCTEPEI
jgi:hypothetical protein